MSEQPAINWSEVAATPARSAADAVSHSTTGRDRGRRSRSRSLARGIDRAGSWAFGALLVVAFGAALWLGRRQWFLLDEWEVLSGRSASSLDDLFRPHNEHWSTLPVLVYRVLFAVFGLRTYVPYQVAIVVTHLALVALLWLVMRRAGVSSWVATATAAVLVLFGAGSQNIVWGFQIGFVGAMAFGVGQLLLADHEDGSSGHGRFGWLGAFDRRDGLGLAAGAAALMCSGVGITMLAVVGVGVLLRRGWRAAAFHVVPLAVLVGVWLAIEQPETNRNPVGAGTVTIAGKVAAFVGTGIWATFGAVSHYSFLGLALAALLVGGLVLAWLPLDRPTFRRTASMPVALLVGGVLFLVVSGSGRWYFGADFARSSRYLYMTLAFALPAMAVAAQAFVSRWRWSTPVVLLVLLVGVPANLTNFLPTFPYSTAYFDGQRNLLIAAARSPLAKSVPDSVQPDPINAEGVTIGWLRRSDTAGKLPPTVGPIDALEAQMPVRLGFAESSDPAPGANCRTVTGVTPLKTAKGQVFSIRGNPFQVATLGADGKPKAPVSFNPTYFGLERPGGHTYTVELPKLNLVVIAALPVELCGP